MTRALSMLTVQKSRSDDSKEYQARPAIRLALAVLIGGFVLLSNAPAAQAQTGAPYLQRDRRPDREIKIAPTYTSPYNQYSYTQRLDGMQIRRQTFANASMPPVILTTPTYSVTRHEPPAAQTQAWRQR